MFGEDANDSECCGGGGGKIAAGGVVGGTAGGLMAAALVTGGSVALVGTGTVVGAPIGWVVGGSIVVGGAIGAGSVWLWQHFTNSNNKEPEPSPQSTPDKQRGSNNQKTKDAAQTGQEAHRQEQKKLKDKGADVEVPMTLPKTGNNVRKDAVMPDGTAVIIKPNTPSGRKSAEKREELMKKNDIPTQRLEYDPANPAYQPNSPSFIGPKKPN